MSASEDGQKLNQKKDQRFLFMVPIALISEGIQSSWRTVRL